MTRSSGAMVAEPSYVRVDGGASLFALCARRTMPFSFAIASVTNSCMPPTMNAPVTSGDVYVTSAGGVSKSPPPAVQAAPVRYWFHVALR